MGDLLDSILNPKSFRYELSEDLFLDLWETWGKPRELVNAEEINSFLKELVDKSNGLVIVDHYSYSNYDHIHKVVFDKPYTKIFWKDFNNLRIKNLEKKLDEFETLNWQLFGFGTYLYTLLHIRKIKFKIIDNHLYVLLLSNLIPSKKVEKYLVNGNSELISTDNYSEEFYTEYSFFEGEKKDLIKHICTVNNLPYYTCLIQPKEGASTTAFSKTIMLVETINETKNRMKKVKEKLEESYEYDYDNLFAQGNTIRRILEYVFKFYCLIKELDLKIDEKYGNTLLGELRKEINKADIHINIDNRIIKMANELSHDSGQVFSKEEIIQFAEDVQELLDQVYVEILNQ